MVTAACSVEESYDQPRWHIQKQSYYFANKDLSSQSYGFSSSLVWMWELDHKEGWRRLLRVPWTARRSNQSFLKEINLEYSLEGMLLKPKLQYFGPLIRRANSLEKTLMLGKIEGRRKRGWQRMRWLDGHCWHNGHEFEPTPGHSGGQRSLVCCSH